MASAIEALPYERQIEILLNLPYGDIISYCSTSKSLSYICKDDYFWQQKIKHDKFGYISTYEDMPARLLYKYLYYMDLYINSRSPEDRFHLIGFDVMAKYGQLDVLRWFEQNGIEIRVTLKGAIEDERLDVLRWFERRDRLPTVDGANWAALNGKLDVLRWLERRGILPNVNGANMAAAYGHLDALRWLESRGILPNVNGADRAAYNGNLDVLRWLERRDILPVNQSASWAAQNGNLDVLRWLERRGILPTSDDSRYATAMNKTDTIRWLESRGIY